MHLKLFFHWQTRQLPRKARIKSPLKSIYNLIVSDRISTKHQYSLLLTNYIPKCYWKFYRINIQETETCLSSCTKMSYLVCFCDSERFWYSKVHISTTTQILPVLLWQCIMANITTVRYQLIRWRNETWHFVLIINFPVQNQTSK